MTFNFIKKIVEKKVDDDTHRKFVRYSIGQYEKEELKIKFGPKIQIWAGLEYVDVFFGIISSQLKENIEMKGAIFTSKEIGGVLEDLKIEPKEIKKTKTGKKYVIEAILNPESFRKFYEQLKETYLLINLKTKNLELKTKSSLPKIGTLVEKFVSLKVPSDYEAIIRDEFCFGSRDKEVSIRCKYVITDIIIPKELENKPAEARIKAKRKGKLILTVNGKEKEYDLLV